VPNKPSPLSIWSSALAAFSATWPSDFTAPGTWSSAGPSASIFSSALASVFWAPSAAFLIDPIASRASVIAGASPLPASFTLPSACSRSARPRSKRPRLSSDKTRPLIFAIISLSPAVAPRMSVTALSRFSNAPSACTIILRASSLNFTAFSCNASNPDFPAPGNRVPGSMNSVLISSGSVITTSLSPSSVADSIPNSEPTGIFTRSSISSSTCTLSLLLSSGRCATLPIFAPPIRTSDPLISPEASSNTTERG